MQLCNRGPKMAGVKLCLIAAVVFVAKFVSSAPVPEVVNQVVYSNDECCCQYYCPPYDCEDCECECYYDEYDYDAIWNECDSCLEDCYWEPSCSYPYYYYPYGSGDCYTYDGCYPYGSGDCYTYDGCYTPYSYTDRCGYVDGCDTCVYEPYCGEGCDISYYYNRGGCNEYAVFKKKTVTTCEESAEFYKNCGNEASIFPYNPECFYGCPPGCVEYYEKDCCVVFSSYPIDICDIESCELSPQVPVCPSSCSEEWWYEGLGDCWPDSDCECAYPCDCDCNYGCYPDLPYCCGCECSYYYTCSDCYDDCYTDCSDECSCDCYDECYTDYYDECYTDCYDEGEMHILPYYGETYTDYCDECSYECCDECYTDYYDECSCDCYDESYTDCYDECSSECYNESCEGCCTQEPVPYDEKIFI